MKGLCPQVVRCNGRAGALSPTGVQYAWGALGSACCQPGLGLPRGLVPVSPTAGSSGSWAKGLPLSPGLVLCLFPEVGTSVALGWKCLLAYLCACQPCFLFLKEDVGSAALGSCEE